MTDIDKQLEQAVRVFTDWVSEVRPVLATAMRHFAKTINDANDFILSFRTPEYVQREVAAVSIRKQFGVHHSMATWVSWRLPEQCLPDIEAVKALMALEQL